MLDHFPARTALLAVFTCLALDATARCQQTPAGRPNFLFVLADDQSPYDLPCYNPRSELHCPTLDRLAAEGMVVDAAYHMGAWVGAVCTSSRHMIMSGRTLWHIPDRAGRQSHNPNTSDPRLVPPDLAEFTLAAVFNRAGYDTLRTCKQGNSYDAANKQFTERHEATKRGGDAESGSPWHAQRVLDFLDQREAEEDRHPFLVYLGFSHPHDPRIGTPELLDRYGAVNHADRQSLPAAHARQPALPVNYLPAHPFHHGHPDLRDEVAVSGVWTRRDEQTIRNELGRQFACSEYIDQQIGRVLERLQALGELQNTYIIYTADHGMAIGRHGLQGKQNLYEHTWRVPFIVKGPGIAPGSRAAGNIYLLDVLATLCDLADIEPPTTNEGVSFRAVLEGQQATIRDTLYGCYCGGTKPGIRSLRHGDWKLIEYDVLDGQVRETQLFNLAENPHEFLKQHQAASVRELTQHVPAEGQINLAEDPQYADKLTQMRQRLAEEMRRLDDPYRLWNQPP
ncbi:MAG: sulfatase-like hydrolase/transferase [Planctomycetales bacterium]|nr:sulfatase-like hydrolase/transferase [Planctomycetales bacterium]